MIEQVESDAGMDANAIAVSDVPYFVRTGLALPIAAAALHDGHAVRPEVDRALRLTPDERRREEDPFTSGWAEISDTRLIGRRSRFEVDLNRPRSGAVYRTPEKAWGLRVWHDEPDVHLVERSLAQHDAFYRAAYDALSALQRQWGRFAVLDLHTYNYRRGGPDAPPAPLDTDPEVNIGTGSMDRERWAPVVERFIEDLRNPRPLGRRLHVRENVKFRGGYFPTWVHRTFPDSGCAIAIEFRKFFMDEWSGQADPRQVARIGRLLAESVPGIVASLSLVRS